MAAGRGILSYLRRLCFPPLCASCRTLLDWQTPEQVREDPAFLCDACQREWISETLETCGTCAKRLGDCFCQTALMEEARCEGFCKLTYYRIHESIPVQNRIIFSIKQRNNQNTFRFLALALAPMVLARLSELKISHDEVILTHLPRMRRRVLDHGFDQAKELAKELSRVLGIPHRSLILRRSGDDHMQKDLSAVEREKNAKRAFLPTKTDVCRGRTVLLVDDIVTTGAGMAACTRILRKMKAARVIAIAVAWDVRGGSV